MTLHRAMYLKRLMGSILWSRILPILPSLILFVFAASIEWQLTDWVIQSQNLSCFLVLDSHLGICHVETIARKVCFMSLPSSKCTSVHFLPLISVLIPTTINDMEYIRCIILTNGMEHSPCKSSFNQKSYPFSMPKYNSVCASPSCRESHPGVGPKSVPSHCLHVDFTSLFLAVALAQWPMSNAWMIRLCKMLWWITGTNTTHPYQWLPTHFPRQIDGTILSRKRTPSCKIRSWIPISRTKSGQNLNNTVIDVISTHAFNRFERYCGPSNMNIDRELFIRFIGMKKRLPSGHKVLVFGFETCALCNGMASL